jgi:2-iminobutanoate/2-iminopropanoate deaminase
MPEEVAASGSLLLIFERCQVWAELTSVERTCSPSELVGSCVPLLGRVLPSVDPRSGWSQAGLVISGPTGRSFVKVIHTEDAPPHTGPVPQAVEAGGWIYVSALFGADPGTHEIPTDAREEAEQLFANLTAILAAAGAGLTDVVRVGIVMRALQRDRPVFNQVWTERFGEHRPARSAIEASDFGRKGENARFMVEVVAYRG